MTRKLSVRAKVSSLALAAALAAGPSPAAAQSLLGTPTVASGSANITEGATTTDISLDASQTVIDWTPDDNAVGNFGVIAFQNSGTTATFSSTGDFAVLNRVNVADSSRGVFMNGNINSLVNGQTGGSVFFYSPSGFVIGANAVINVGSLVLSASPIAVDGNGNFINGTSVTFNQAPNSNALINTVAGSQINANGSGSYVALVAPVITHHGTIRTDTAAALVAAEAATINFSPDGLFDIQVTVGTDDPNGVDVDGGIIARNSATEGVGNHHAYLVAVAKNDAVTMLVRNGGSVGFDTATSAAVEDNVVVLAGGYDVNFGSSYITTGTSTVGLTIDNAAFSTDTFATVTGGATITTSTGPTTFGNDFSLTAGGPSYIQAINGNTLTIGGNLYANVDQYAGLANSDVSGSLVRLAAYGASNLTVGGNVNLSANAYGHDAADNGLDGGNATGGTVIVQTGTNSSITIGGTLDVTADGFGGDNFYGDGAGGNGTGGTAQILSETSGASISVGSSASVSAEGFGGSSGECSVCNITGGNGTGGNILVQADGGGSNLQFDSGVTLAAAGSGGSGDLGGGGGFGGTASLGAADGSTTTVGAGALVDASGFGGYGYASTGGTGIGGRATISTFGTAGSLVDLTGDVFVIAGGTGGDVGDFSGTGTGGTGTGGQAAVNAILGTIHAHNNLFVSAQSTGGTALFASGHGGDGVAIQSGPNLTEASLFAAAGTLTVDGLTTVNASATGGDGSQGGNGGDAVAGGVAGTIGGGAVIHAANRDDGSSIIQLGDVIVVSDAQGGNGGVGQGGLDGGDGGTGGSATGGKAVVTAAAGSGDLTAGLTILSASAEGGAGGGGGNSDGGNGGNGGAGGQATGGFINVGTESGNVNFAQGANNGTATYASIVSFTSATGGVGGDGTFGTVSGVGGRGGDAFGGQNFLLVRGSLVTVGNVNLDASATGGNGGLSPAAPKADGGDATAGQIGVLVTNRFNLPAQRGTLDAGNITGTSIATGGTGGLGDGLSLAVGGSNQFIVRNSDATTGNVSLIASADAFSAGTPFAASSLIELLNGTVNIGGAFTFQTLGPASMWIDAGTFNAAQINVDADNFIHDDAQLAPVTPGLFSANNIFLTTGQDLIVDAHMQSVNGLGFTAPGLVSFLDVKSNGPLAIHAGTTLDAGNLQGGALVFAEGGGDVTVGTVTTGGNAQVSSIGGGVTTGNILAGGNVHVIAVTDISTGNVGAAGLVLEQAGGAIASGNINSGDFISVISNNGSVTLGDLTAVSTIDLDATGDIIFGDVSADDIDFSSGGAVAGGDIIVGTDASGDADGAITLGTINVGITLAGGPADQGFAVGIASGTSISVGNVDADEAIGFASLGPLTTGNLNAGTDVLAMVGGNMNLGAITTGATGRTYLADAQMFLDAGGPDNFDPSLVFNATPLRSGGAITIAGPVSTGSFQAAATSITTGAITAPVGIYLDSGDFITTGALNSAGSIQGFSDGSTLTGNINSSGADIRITSGGNMTLGNLVAGLGPEAISLDAGGSILLGNAIAAGGIDFDANGTVTGLNITTGSELGGGASGAVSLGNISAGLVNPQGPVADGFSVELSSSTSISVGSVAGAEGVAFATPGALTTANIAAGTDFLAMASGNMSFGSITASGRTYLADSSMFALSQTGPDFDRAPIFAATPVPSTGSITILGPVSTGSFQAAAASITTGNITAPLGIYLDSANFISTGNLSGGSGAVLLNAQAGAIGSGDISGGDINLSAAGAIGAGNILTSGDFSVASLNNSLTFGNIDAAGFVLLEGSSVDTNDISAGTSIELNASTGDVTTGDLLASSAVSLTAGGGIVSGDISGGGNVALSATGAIGAGNIIAGGFFSAASSNGPLNFLTIDATGFVFLEGSSIVTDDIAAGSSIELNATTGNLTTGDLLASNAMSLTAGGAISSGNISGGGNIALTAGTNLTTLAINAPSINAHAGGLATLNDLWSAPSVELWSNDIDIAATSGIDAGTTGLIRLVSTNAAQAQIGDGLSGSGYQLSNAEFGRLSSGSVQIGARGDASAAIDMLIGDLTVTGPAAGSTIDDPFGSVVFATGDPVTQVAGGVIRVTGDIAASGFGADNALEFYANRFELDAATGSISILGSGTTSSGTLYIEANRIHVASGSILDQLASNPQYAGYQTDLNSPATVQRPEGVIRPGNIDVLATGLQALLVQNTGSADTQAGFLTFGDGPLDPAGVTPGSIELIINGQLITQGGTLTGVAVRDYLIDANNIGVFTANSTINGCALSGACGIIPPPPPPPPRPDPIPPGETATPGIQDEITLIGDDLLPPPEFGNEDFIDDNDDTTEDGTTSPIEPPLPLFDTSELDEASGSVVPEVGTPMRSNPGLTDTGDVDDPVSGGGNPGLMETPPGPPPVQEKQP